MLLKKNRWLDHHGLQRMLHRSFLEFNVSDSRIQQSILAKYTTELKEKNLLSLELFQGDNLVASAISVYKKFYSNCGPLNLSFLTQVIVQEQYRNQGYLKILMEEAKDADMNNSSLGSIVIARRKVGNLYSKFGYIGFGIFPKVVVDNIHASQSLTMSIPIDLEMIAKAYEYTHQGLPGSIYRTKEYWKYLEYEILKSRYSFDSIRAGNEYGYIIYSKGECFEIASSKPALYPSLIEKSLSLGVNTFKIGSNHPAFRTLITSGGEYSIRPEATEGHLLRPYKEGGFLGDYLAEISTKLVEDSASEKFLIDINLLNEW